MKKLILLFATLLISILLYGNSYGLDTWQFFRGDLPDGGQPPAQTFPVDSTEGEALDDFDPCSLAQYAKENPDHCAIGVIAKVSVIFKFHKGFDQCQAYLTTLDEKRIHARVNKDYDIFSQSTCNLLYQSMLTGKYLRFSIIPTGKAPANAQGYIQSFQMTETSDPDQDISNWKTLPNAF